MPDTTTDLDADLKTEVTWRPAAWQEYQAILNHCHKVGAYFGQECADPMRASVLHCIGSVLMSGPTTIFRDGELSLYIVTPHITMGMVFHRDDDTKMLTRIGAAQHGYTTIEAGWPRTGEWSMHS